MRTSFFVIGGAIRTSGLRPSVHIAPPISQNSVRIYRCALARLTAFLQCVPQFNESFIELRYALANAWGVDMLIFIVYPPTHIGQCVPQFAFYEFSSCYNFTENSFFKIFNKSCCSESYVLIFEKSQAPQF